MAQVAAPRKFDLGPGFWPVTIAVTIVNLVLGYYIATFPIENYLPEAATPAGDIDALFKFMASIGNAIFLYITTYLVYFSVVWRRRAGDTRDAVGIQVHDSPKLELWWTIVPTVLVIAIAVFSVRIWMNLQNASGDVLTMESIGHQFKFEFRYPTLKSSVYDEMHVPVDVPVTVQVTSADVIHSFWVPEVRLKYDMVPGLVQSVRFTPHRIGKYRVICTEFCGTQHANMYATMYIDSPQDFNSWIAGQRKAQAASGGAVALGGGNAGAGQATFQAKCTACHGVGGFDAKVVGPGLGKILKDPAHPKLVTGETASPTAIAHILQKGYQGPDNSQGKAAATFQAAMPNQAANGISNGDIANLVAYLSSLSK